MGGHSWKRLELTRNGRNGWKLMETGENIDDYAVESNGIALSLF